MGISRFLEDLPHEIEKLPLFLGDSIVGVQLVFQPWDPIRVIGDENKFNYSLNSKLAI